MSNKVEVSSAASILARKAGRATLKKHGVKHYKEMAKIRWAKVALKKAKKVKK